MPTILEVVRGDVNDTRVVRIGGLANLDQVQSVNTHVWNATTRATLSASVADPAKRTIVFSFGTWLRDHPEVVGEFQVWNLEHELVFADTSALTWPGGDPDLVHVRNSGD